jgi:hypothetical protein
MSVHDKTPSEDHFNTIQGMRWNTVAGAAALHSTQHYAAEPYSLYSARTHRALVRSSALWEKESTYY